LAHEALPAFAGWSGPRHPKLLIVGEAWGDNELQARQPFVGNSGLLLWEMLGEAMPDVEPEWHSQSLFEGYRYGPAWIRGRSKWLEAAGIAYTNVFNLHPVSNRLESICCAKKDLPGGYSLPALSLHTGYIRPEFIPELDRLLLEISLARPNCILAAGNSACWALLRATNIGAIRGAVTLSATEPTTKVVPTYHPAAILRQWSWRPVTLVDIMKALREAEYPELKRPERYIIINPDLHDILNWVDDLLLDPPDLLSVDIETHWKMISCIGFARSERDALVIPFLNPRNSNQSYWATADEEKSAWLAVKYILESYIPKLFQNGMYDLQYIIRMGIRPKNIAEDTMLLHHSLFPEMRKGLGFLGSIYSNEAAWKLMGRPKADTVKRDE
jgi:uracil-DNA glycosylase